MLGCGVGYGLLHRIPKPQDRAQLPPEDDDDVEEEQQHHDHQQHQQHSHQHEEYEEDLRSDGLGGYNQQRESYPRGGGREREPVRGSMDGYDEAEYEQNGDYLVSEGVEVVPVEEEQDYSGFVDPSSYASASQMSIPPSQGKAPTQQSRSSYGSSAGGYAPAPASRGSLGHGNRQPVVVNEE